MNPKDRPRGNPPIKQEPRIARFRVGEKVYVKGRSINGFITKCQDSKLGIIYTVAGLSWSEDMLEMDELPF